MRTSRIQLRILEAFEAHPCDTDLYINDLYKFAFVNGDDGTKTDRERQQRLGANIYRLNAKLHDRKIVPGTVKRTYRMVRT